MARRNNNKRNRRRATFYHINQFDYEVRKKLSKGTAILEKTHTNKKAKMVEFKLNY